MEKGGGSSPGRQGLVGGAGRGGRAGANRAGRLARGCGVPAAACGAGEASLAAENGSRVCCLAVPAILRARRRRRSRRPMADSC